ncbi:PT domain-containing protein [Methanoculleus sp.]|uniref:PT domain-containing protein n=1 Tax=Methanoculleus sp. TaxID=90427 RepID=UPI001BD2CF5D|nr:PT domain-containing protein [Methanoculleus sp.]
MRKIFYLLLVFVLILFACSAGCTSSTSEMSARAATQTPLAPDFKYSVGDVISNNKETLSGFVVVEYRSETDKYILSEVHKDSIDGPWSNTVNGKISGIGRVETHGFFKYHVGHVNIAVKWTSPTTVSIRITDPTIEPVANPTVKPTVGPTAQITPQKDPTARATPAILRTIPAYGRHFLGDVISSSPNGDCYTAWVVVDYKDLTDEYYIRTISRDSINEPWGKVSASNPPKWSDRVSVNKQYPHRVGQVEVPSSWRTTSNPTATPVPTVTYQNGDLWIDISQSRNRVGNLALALADDIDYMDFQSMKSNGEKLEQTAQRDYNTISKYRVSSDYQNLKTKYLSSLDKVKYAGKYCKMAADEYLNGNEDKSTEYLYKAQDYLDSATPDLDAVVKEMGW